MADRLFATIAPVTDDDRLLIARVWEETRRRNRWRLLCWRLLHRARCAARTLLRRQRQAPERDNTPIKQ